jgi:hypothetical protein
MLEAGVLPPPPEEMQGMELNVEFVSMLAQAQRAIGTNGVDRFVGNLGMVAQYKPDVLDKFNADEWADAYSDMLGVDPKLIVANDQVAIVRDARNKAQAAQAQTEAMHTQSEVARNLAGAQTTEPSALTNVMDMFSGYNSR